MPDSRYYESFRINKYRWELSCALTFLETSCFFNERPVIEALLTFGYHTPSNNRLTMYTVRHVKYWVNLRNLQLSSSDKKVMSVIFPYFCFCSRNPEL